MRTVHLGFRAMSTDVVVTVVTDHPDPVDGEGHLAWARARVAELERCWSRFLPDSEISRLNRADGSPLEVSADTVTAVRAACAAWVVTGGRFDPTVHDSLLRLGYDDTIDVVARRGGGAAAVALPAPGCDGVVFDEAQRIVHLPVGVRLDLGGIGKGLAADLVVADLLARGARGAMVSVGGDLRVAGTPPNGEAWIIDVEDPRTDLPLARLELLDGGVATSTTLRRRWRTGQRPHHHLLAPTTGASTTSDVVGVTVVADTAAWADALSKVPFVDPTGTACFDHAGALVVHADGDVRTIGHVPGHVHGAVHTTSS
ncbi:MAG: FAD:protein FMN transferase [Acidimicrobiales bacterium]|nr:FAD:protein FMN transferase [Acidimicrobiales bacterium]MCB9394734.1 FAD:protein FMN transferase [Acidimicrobiaceae bacterium]